MMILWGDLHCHCGITYGFGSLENALDIARTHLDFCSITGHAMWPDIYARDPDTAFIVDFHQAGFEKLRAHWLEVRETIANYNDARLVTFQGYEMHSSRYGDHHFLSPDDAFPLIYRDSPGALVRDCGCEAIAVPHHIGYTPGYRGIDWNLFDEQISPVVEVCSKHGCAMSDTAPFAYYHDMGPRDPRNTVSAGLRQGKHFSFVGSTDHHAGFPGSYGDGLTAVWAKEKSRAAIWGALRAGRTYAVTGDRIVCDFTVNGVYPGGKVSEAKRHLTCRIEAEYWPDKLVLYKNMRPIRVLCGEELLADTSTSGRYKLRVETGWGNSEDLFQWDCGVRVEGGHVRGGNVYFRGRSVLSPTNTDDSRFDNINLIQNKVTGQDDTYFGWTCQTIRNKSTLHPQTDAAVVEIEGDLKTRVEVTVNAHKTTRTVAELLESGWSAHMKPYHAQAYKVHTLMPEACYSAVLELEDQAESEEDFYHVEFSQKNGHCAFLSPIYMQA